MPTTASALAPDSEAVLFALNYTDTSLWFMYICLCILSLQPSTPLPATNTDNPNLSPIAQPKQMFPDKRQSKMAGD